MKKTHLCFAMMFITSSLIAQNDKVKFGLSVFPNFSVELVNSDGSAPRNVVDKIKNNHVWKPSYSIQINVTKEINTKWSVITGIGYQNNGGRTKVTEIFSIAPGPIPNPVFIGKSRGIFNHHNIEIPLLLKRKISDSYYVIGGGSTVYNILNTVTSKVWDRNDKLDKTIREDKSASYREVNVYFNLGIGREFSSKGKFNWFIQPFAQLGLLGIAHSVPVNRNILSVGIVTGVVLK